MSCGEPKFCTNCVEKLSNNNAYAQALADERERINKALDEEIEIKTKSLNFYQAELDVIHAFEKAKEIVNGGE